MLKFRIRVLAPLGLAWALWAMGTRRPSRIGVLGRGEPRRWGRSSRFPAYPVVRTPRRALSVCNPWRDQGLQIEMEERWNY